jgi:hypothetical protein
MYQVRLVARWPLPYGFQPCRATDRGFMLTWGTPVCNLQRRSTPAACIHRRENGVRCANSAFSVVSPTLDIKFFRLLCALHDEPESGRRILADQFVHDAVGHDLVGHLDSELPAGTRIQGGFPEHLRHHLAEPFEPRDLGRRAVAVRRRCRPRAVQALHLPPSPHE